MRYTDGAFVSTRLSGALALEGPLLGGGGLLSGRIDLGATEISDRRGPRLQRRRHAGAGDATCAPRPAVQITLDRAQVDEPRPAEAGGQGGLALDVRISAPNRIFVRGRGLDVELGGDLRIRGTTSDIQPVGQFDLRRGRLLILGQRIEFQEGSLQLIGNLDPELFFVARTRSGDVTAIVTVEGRVSDPQITFSSEPPLPQDEVLARVLFRRATAEPLAVPARPARRRGGRARRRRRRRPARRSCAAPPASTTSTSSPTTTAQTAVRAGKYIDDNIYLDVQTGIERRQPAPRSRSSSTTASPRAARSSSDGNTTLGIFYERDY